MRGNPIIGRRGILAGLATAAAGFGHAAPVLAQPAVGAWPSRPLRILVPYAAGGSTDILTRLLAQRLGESLGHPVVVENRGGAGGSLGTAAFATASFDDHYFLMVSQSQISINQYLFKSSLGYDPVNDLRPVGLVAQTANVVVVPPSLPVTSFAELIAYCKARPGRVAYSSAGVGSTGHLLNELLKTTVGIDVVHIPYRGNGPAMQALLTGEVQFNTDNMPQLLQQVRGNRLRPLAVTSAQRWWQLPEVPTVAELGFPTLTTAVWFGIVAQARMPLAVVERMNAAINSALEDPGFTARLRENSLEAIPGTSEAMAQLAERERHRWKAVVEASGATAE
jgi:tripartite-type tricarboxylate transporter receptor subunit TctC